MTDTYRTLGDPVDERTPALALPLPHLLNDTRDDVPRLRMALDLIDAAVQLLGLDMDSRDDALDARAALLEWGAARPTAVAYSYDGDGRVQTTTATVAGVARVTTFTYDGTGRVDTASYVVAGGSTRTETFNYDAGTGQLTGVTAVETAP